jgi:1,4-dihydroxy-2-naphthoate octaprenyltransferase
MRSPISLLRVIRLHIVLGGILGFSLGVLFPSINSKIEPRITLLSYLALLFTDLSTHYSNDYFDAELDKNANWKPFGGRNVLNEYPSLDSWMIRIATLLSTSSLVLATLLVVYYPQRWTFLVLIILGNVLGWAYSSPWICLKASGLGELAISFFTGFIVPVTGNISVTGFITMDFILYTIPLILYGFILSIYLEIPDHEVDREHRINNLVVRFGVKTMMIICFLLSTINTVYYSIGAVPFISKRQLSFLSLLPLVTCFYPLIKGIRSRKNIEQNTSLVITGLFVFIIGMNIILIFLP